MTYPETLNLENEQSLQTLIRAIQLSQGDFSLILLRCNYADLRDRIIHKLRESSPIQIREITLPTSVKTLYTTLLAQLQDEQPQALMISGLESVTAIDKLLTSTRYVREEFRKNCPFPMLLWVNDFVLYKLNRLATDFANWATRIKFILTTDELVKFLHQKTDEMFASSSHADPQICWEIETACADLQNHRQVIEPVLQAGLEFLLGCKNYLDDQIDTALDYYHSSLSFWEQNHHLERQGVLLLHIALAHYRQSEQHRVDSHLYLEETKYIFQQCLEIFEQAARLDLVAQHINKLGEVLQHLRAWEELYTLVQKSLALHQMYGTQLQIAQDYGFLAEISLEKSCWHQAHDLCQQALQILDKIPNLKSHNRGWHLFILARSLQHLGQTEEAIKHLKAARKESKPQYDPKLYIEILESLRSLYYQQGQYLEAFRIKQQKISVEHQYGFRAFIGAAYLIPQRELINPTIEQVEKQGRVAQEIAASGRQQDINILIERISSPQYKLIVIHGQSGVGKSSILQAGLIPALKQQAIDARDTLPIILRVYTDWVGTLGRCLSEMLENLEVFNSTSLPATLDSITAIINQLRNNAQRNLLTVLIFDQFEEFFFVYTDPEKRRVFYEFLHTCLNINFIKVIISLREDYLHYLLEWERLFDLTVINNNILDKHIRYYLGNFSPTDTKAVIQSLTERSQFYLEPTLVDKLVEDLAGCTGEVRPIELQIVGAQLQTDKVNTIEKYQQVGTKKKLVERFLEEVIKDCGAENEPAARLILYLLTDENGTRPLKTRADLAIDLATEANKLDLVLEIFVKSGLVVLLPESPFDLYQLVHDYLVSFIRQQQGNELLTELAKEREHRLQTEEKLKREQQANQILTGANRQGRITLTISSIAALVVLISSSMYASDKISKAQQGTELERAGVSALTQFEFADEIKTLLLAMSSGRKLQQFVRDDLPLARYPAASPLLALQTILYKIRERNILQGHQGWVSNVDFSPNGRYLATAGVDGKVQLWDLSGKQLMQLHGHQGPVYDVRFSPNGQYLATTGADGTARLWDLSGQLKAQLRGHQGWVNIVQFSPHGQYLVTRGEDGTARLWNLSGQQLVQLRGHQGRVNDVQFSPNGQYLATVGVDGTARLWNLSGQQVAQLRGHQGWVNSVRFSPNGKYIATAGADGTARLWSLSGQQLTQLRGHQGWVNDVQFSPDGQRLVTRGVDDIVRLWDLSGQLTAQLRGHQGLVNAVQFSPDGQYIVTVGADSTTRLWDVSGKQLEQLRGHQGWVNGVQFSPKGRYLATLGADGTTRLWDFMHKSLTELHGHTGRISNVQFSPHGLHLATTGEDGTVRLWNVSGQQLLQLSEFQSLVNEVQFSPNGQYFMTRGADDTVCLWDLSGKLLTQLRAEQGWINEVLFSPDGQSFMTMGEDGTIRLWDLSGTLLTQLHGHQGPVNAVRFSPNGQFLASAGTDRIVHLWDLSRQQLVKSYSHPDLIWSVEFSPDGQRLAIAGADGTVRLWSLSGQQVAHLQGHRGPVWSVRFNAKGKLLITAGEDNTARLWDLSGTQLAQLNGHQGPVNEAQFSPNDQHLVTKGEDGTARLWDLTGRQIAEFDGEIITFSPDGKRMATVSKKDDSKVQLWPVESLDGLLIRGCAWLKDYLRNNPDVTEQERSLCPDI